LSEATTKREDFPWSITPVHLPGIAFFEVVEASRLPILNPMAIIFALSVVFGMLFTLEGLYGYVVLCASVAVAAFVIPQIASIVRRRNTYYEIYADRIIFHLYETFTPEVRELPLEKVRIFKYEAYTNDVGHVHILTENDPPFRTRTYAGKPRFYPTLEGIPDCIELCDQLNGLLSVAEEE
jgi:hypothetical protein